MQYFHANKVVSVIAAALLFFPACGEDILGPLNDTVFVLRTVDGDDLPATTFFEFSDLAWIVEADTIWFESGSKWRRHSFQRRDEEVGGDPLDTETDGTVLRIDGELVLNFKCRDTDCIVPDRGVQSGTHLEMEQTYKHGGRNLIFERI